MAAHCSRIDDLVKDYLQFRGLSFSLKTFETELKNEKEKQFRADKMIEQLQSYIVSYDLHNLWEYWNFLNTRLFARLEQRYSSSVRKLEISLLRYYLVHAAQNSKQDKIIDFFERMTDVLQNLTEFKEWFAFPFVRNPEENSNFRLYFSKQWQDTFLLSLHNFFSVVLQAMPVPVLLNFESDYKHLKQYQEENERLRQQILSLGEKPNVDYRSSAKDRDYFEHNNFEFVYDFSSLGEDTTLPEARPKSPRKFFPSSLNIVKKPEIFANKKAEPKRDDLLRMATIPKDTKQQRSSKLLPVITRQKKPRSTSAAGTSQSVYFDSVAANQSADVTASQKGSESVITQKPRKSDGVKPDRKEVVDGMNKSAGLEKKSSERTEFSRSVSESAAADFSRPLSRSAPTRRTVSKSMMETKSAFAPVVESRVSDETSGSPPPVLPLDTIATGLTTVLSTVAAGTMSELQSFPPIKSPTEEQGVTSISKGREEETTVNEAAAEKPFILLSQEEYSEHRSAISHSRFSTSGHYIASVDVDGVVKVWTCSPQPHTEATVMSKSPFLSLEWAIGKTDRWIFMIFADNQNDSEISQEMIKMIGTPQPLYNTVVGVQSRNRLLLGNRSGNIRLFDVKEMKSFYEATGDPSYPRVICLCSNPAAAMFVCASTTGRARAGALGGDIGGATGNRVGKLMLWDLKTMKAERQLPLDPGPVGINCCCFNHNGQVLLTGGVDGMVRLFDVQQQRCISQWEAHTGEIRGIQYNSNFTSFYSVGADNKLVEWSMLGTNKKLRDLPIHQGVVPDFQFNDSVGNRETPRGKLLAFDSDGQYMLSCNDANALIYKMIKDPPGLAHVMELKVQKSSLMTTVDWSPNIENIETRICLTGSLDGKITVSTLIS